MFPFGSSCDHDPLQVAFDAECERIWDRQDRRNYEDMLRMGMSNEDIIRESREAMRRQTQFDPTDLGTDSPSDGHVF